MYLSFFKDQDQSGITQCVSMGSTGVYGLLSAISYKIFGIFTCTGTMTRVVCATYFTCIMYGVDGREKAMFVANRRISMSQHGLQFVELQGEHMAKGGRREPCTMWRVVVLVGYRSSSFAS